MSGEKAYWKGKLNKMPMSPDIGKKLKNIERNMNALDRQIRSTEKRSIDLGLDLIDNKYLPDTLRNTPANDNLEETEIDAGSHDVRDATPVRPITELLGAPPEIQNTESIDMTPLLDLNPLKQKKRK